MKLSPSEIESLVVRHFGILYSINETILLEEADFSFSWLRCAITDKGKALLIEVNSFRSPFTVDDKSHGRSFKGRICIEEVDKLIEDENRKFLAIICRRTILDNLFARLLADIIWHLFNEGPQTGDPYQYISNRLAGWRLLFSGYDNKSEEKGLIGELYVLHNFLCNYNMPISIWQGPLGATKDFRLANQNVEVKTTTIRNGYFVEINGLFQLATTQTIERLVFIRLEETPNGIYWISNMISKIRNHCSKTFQLDELQNRLSQFSTDVLNSNTRWDILEAVVIEIDDSFPKINESSFVNDRLPTGILNITWTADLTSLPKNRFFDFSF